MQQPGHGEVRPRTLLEHYSEWFSDDLIDLSSSSAPAQLLELSDTEISLDYCPPQGGEALRELIAELYESVTPDCIVLTSGASEALVATVNAIAPKRAVIDRGAYESFIAAAHRLGVELQEESEGESVDAMYVLCNPTVPDGRLRRDLPAGRPLVVDEVHLPFADQNDVPPPAADAVPGAVSVSSLTKALGVGGLRLGWIATQDHDLVRAIDHEVQLLSGGPAAPSVHIAEGLVPNFDTSLQATRAALRDNGPRVLDALRGAGWSFVAPEAGLTVEALPPRHISAEGIVKLLHSSGYFVVPCEVYGTPGSFRFSLLADAADVQRALSIVATTSGEARGEAADR